MKRLLLLCCCYAAFNLNAQVFSEDFEAGLPAGWTIINNGDANTWSITTPGTGTANSGTNVARIDFSATAHDDYLVTSQFTVPANGQLNVFGKNRSSSFIEEFNVLLSTTGNAAADFTVTLAGPLGPSATVWEEYNIDLTAYSGTPVYIAFQAISTDEWQLYLDDVSVTSPTCTNPTATYTVVDDCATSGGFLIDVDVTNLGTATSVTIADNQGNSLPNQGVGTVTLPPTGGYANGTSVTITITNEQDGTCVIMSSALTQAVCPPSNDECAGATTLTHEANGSCTFTNSTLVGSTQSQAACLGSGDNDVWFSFVATATAAVINVDGGPDIVTQVFEQGGGCGALGASIVCSDPNDPTAAGLIVGNTYFVRINVWNTFTTPSAFTICITTPTLPPSNNECATPTMLPLSADNQCASALAGTTEGALNSAGTCSTTGREVWYSYTPTTTGLFEANVTETFESASFISTYLTVWSGSCGALTQIGGTSCFATAATGISMTAGTTYYFVVRSSSTTGYTEFDLCLYPAPTPPANNECATADPLMLSQNDGCANAVIGTTEAATNSAGTCSTTGREVWYAFTPSVTGSYEANVTETFESASTSTYLTIWNGTCGSLTQIGGTSCFVTASSGVMLTAGTTYYFVVRSSSTTAYSEFELCVYRTPGAPANDECAGAVVLTHEANGSCTFTGSTVLSATQSQAACAGSGDKDVWFSFVATAASAIINVDNSPDIVTQVFEGSGGCGALGASLVCSDPNDPTVSGLTIGNTYFVRINVWSPTTTPGTFDICITSPPPPPINDACIDATSIASGVAITQDITASTNVEALTPCQINGGGGDCVAGGTGSTDFGRGVWYVYNSTGPETISIEAGGFDTEIQVFSGACGSLTCVGGDDDDTGNLGSSNSYFCWLSSASFAPVDYYIYIDGHGTAVGTATVELTAAAILPITVSSFDAEAMDRGNKVMWTTETEVNNQYQIIERSEDGAKSWSEVDRITTKGDSKEVRSYEVMDMEPFATSYYRIKAVDFDGYTDYSQVISVSRKADTKKLNVFPNPTTDVINIETALAASGNVNITLVDVQGRVAFTQTLYREKGALTYPVDMQGLSTGMYVLTVSTDDQTFVQRVVKN